MPVFKCNQCQNLHGARVEACGMCGSQDVALVQDTLPPAPGLPPEFSAGAEKVVELLRERLDDVAEGLIDFLHSGSSFFRAGAEWFRSNTETKRDPANPELRGPQWPGPSSPTVDGPKKP